MPKPTSVLRSFRFYEGNTFGGYVIVKAEANYKHKNSYGYVYKMRLELVSKDRYPNYDELRKKMNQSNGRFYNYGGKRVKPKYQCFWDGHNVDRSKNDRSIIVYIKTTVMK